MAATPTPVYVAGIGGSGPEHWQSLWRARTPSAVWVEHDDWDEPVRDVWVRDLDDTLRAVAGPVVLVAHSLGCSLVVEWASRSHSSDVVGALLVAPPDVHGPAFPPSAVGFGSPALRPLPFRTLVVASEDDPYGTLEHAGRLSTVLGAELVNVGPRGHLNASSGLGDWPDGWSLLRPLLAA